MTGLRLNENELVEVRNFVTFMNTRRESLNKDGVTEITFNEEAQMVEFATYFGPTTMPARQFLDRFRQRLNHQLAPT